MFLRNQVPEFIRAEYNFGHEILLGIKKLERFGNEEVHSNKWQRKESDRRRHVAPFWKDEANQREQNEANVEDNVGGGTDPRAVFRTDKFERVNERYWHRSVDETTRQKAKCRKCVNVRRKSDGHGR